MKPLKSSRFLLFGVLFSFLFQTFSTPYALAQRGIFVRESDTKKQDERKSFRVLPEEEEQESTMPAGLLPGAARGMEGGLPRRGMEGAEGTALSPTLGAGGLLYQVHILGEVKRPGTYRVPASTRLSESFQLAGGIKKNGSERSIELRRGGGAGRKIDLISYRLFGRLDDNPYLMDNDVVYVPLKQKVIEVEGAVNRPGIYELKGENRVSDAIRLAGGFSQGVSRKEPIRIIRYDQDEKKQIVDVANASDELKQTELLSGDVIVVPHMFTTGHEFDYNVKELPRDNVFYPSYEDRVFVIGAVEVPGAYDFNQYYKLSNYIAMAGGLNRMAKGQIKLVRSDGTSTKLKQDAPALINPGDTIYVPEKALSRETWISILTTMASLGLTATALFTK